MRSPQHNSGRCPCVIELDVWRDSYTRKGEADGVARNLNTAEHNKLGGFGALTCKQFTKKFLDGPSPTPIALVHTHECNEG